MMRESLETSIHLTRTQMKSDGVLPYAKRMKTSDVRCSAGERDICNYHLENNE